MPSVRTINDWISGKGGVPAEEVLELSAKVARAREEGYDAIAHDCLNIADDNGKDIRITDKGAQVTDHDVIQRAKLRVETRLKLLACWDPKRYGNKIDLTTKGENLNTATSINITREIIQPKE